MYPKMCEELDVTFKQNGILLVARNDKEMETVMMYYKRGKDRGVNLRLVNKEELHEMEPNLSESIVGALYAPEGGSIMPFELAAALMENAIQNGGSAARGNPVINGWVEGEKKYLETPPPILLRQIL